MTLRLHTTFWAPLALCSALLACADEDDVDLSTLQQGGSSASAGKGGSAGSSSGSSGQGNSAGSGGSGGSGAGTAGQGSSGAGAAGAAGDAGAGGSDAGSGGSDAGSGGSDAGSGGSNAGSGGSDAGAGGSDAGAGGSDAGSGGSDAGQGGASGEAGAAGEGGEAGTSGQGGDAGDGGAAGMAGDGGTGGGAGSAGASAGNAGTGGSAGVGGGPCAATVGQFPLEPSPHVETCIPLTFSTNPPSSGNHYGIWAAFKTYSAPIPRGFWVHSMEHGAVVLLYNCPGGCSAEVAELQGLIDAFPADPLCTDPSGPKSRLILVEDPKLDVPFAVAAWGATLKAPCLDEETKGQISAFMTANYAKAPENFCSQGTDIATMTLPDKCGEDDYVPPPTP